MTRIAIYGASGFGREVAWLVEACGGLGPVCFIDDDEAKIGRELNGLPVMGLSQAKSVFPLARVVSGIGIPRIRERVVDKTLQSGFEFETVIHPRVEMSGWNEIGEGTVICAGCILTTNSRLGKQVQINLGCTIGHDVVMGDYTTLAPGVHVSGWVHFGKRVYVGTGAVFINGTEESPLVIGDDVVIGAGACVTKSISSGTWGGASQAFARMKDSGQTSEIRSQMRDYRLLNLRNLQNLWTGLRDGSTLRSKRGSRANTTGWFRIRTGCGWGIGRISGHSHISMRSSG